MAAGGGGYHIGGGGYNGSSGGNTNSGGYIICSGGNGGSYGGGYGGGNVGHQTPSGLPPLPVKRFKNWNYSFLHGGNMDNNHTSTTCACPGKNHHHAATRTNAMGGTMHYMNKTVLPCTVGRCAAPTRPLPPSLNYTSTFSFPMGANILRFPTVPRSWGFGPHTGAYHQANNIPYPQPGTAMMHNTMVFNNAYQHAPPPLQGPPTPANQG